MPHTSQTKPIRIDSGLKPFSCLTCRQRKVRCDRRDPCSNCTRTTRQCSFIPPVRGKPKRRKAPKEGLHAKLRRYEAMLKVYGADIEPSDNGNGSDVEMESEAEAEMVEDGNPGGESGDVCHALAGTRVKLVTKDGASRYFDTDLWTQPGSEFHHPEEEGLSENVATPSASRHEISSDHLDLNGLVLGASTTADLSSLHQPPNILQDMLNYYIDRVDPLMKVLHVPSFGRAMKDALQNPKHISTSLEALIFAFYLVTTASMEDSECAALLGDQKAIIAPRYEAAARQALINADFVRTSSLKTLQAYIMFLMGMRSHYQTEAVFILSGIAVRLARRMGLHRDGTVLGLGPFDTEMRRRLWWHIVHIDCRTSDYSGTRPSTDLFLSDTRMPLNIEDEDLDPGTVDLPLERARITSIVLCLVRCEVMQLLRKFAPKLSDDMRWENLSTPSLTLAEKDSMINQFEDVLERKYLRYHDPANPLHHFASVMSRYSVCKLRLFAHSPRQFAMRGIKVPQSSRDVIFENGMKLLEYGNLMHENQILRKFMWQIGTGYLWDTLLYVLSEIRVRKTGPQVDKAWQLISGAFKSYPQVFTHANEALYLAIGNWTLQVWDDCAAARQAEELWESATPEYITSLRSRQTQAVEPSFGAKSSAKSVRWPGDHDVQCPNNGAGIATPDSMELGDFSKLLSLDLEPNEWVQWERLFARHGG